MSDVGLPQQKMPPLGTEMGAARREQIKRDEASIERGMAELRAGLGVDDDEVEAWLDLLDSDPDAPLPVPRNSLTAL